jgi:hypothetical protein
MFSELIVGVLRFLISLKFLEIGNHSMIFSAPLQFESMLTFHYVSATVSLIFTDDKSRLKRCRFANDLQNKDFLCDSFTEVSICIQLSYRVLLKREMSK